MRNKHCLTWNIRRNSQKRGKSKIHIVGSGLRPKKKLKNVENEIHTVGPGIWQETLKRWKMRNAHLQDLEYVKKL